MSIINNNIQNINKSPESNQSDDDLLNSSRVEELPDNSSADPPTNPPADPPANPPANPPTETPANSPVETPTETPTDPPTETPAEETTVDSNTVASNTNKPESDSTKTPDDLAGKAKKKTYKVKKRSVSFKNKRDKNPDIPVPAPNNNNTKNKKNKTIPDELKIHLHTNVPGFQTIYYQPHMTIPSEKKKSVRFNPLVKLNQNVVDKQPKQIKIKEFFDLGLFTSLINNHGFHKIVTLDEATESGYIENNIEVTLKTIFPQRGLIYINNEVYSIADMAYTMKDWRVTVKPKIALSSQPTQNPLLYNQLIEQELFRGEQQLADYNNDTAYGSNYIGPKNPVVTKKQVPEPNVDEVIENDLNSVSVPGTEDKSVEPPREKLQTSTELIPLPNPKTGNNRTLLDNPPSNLKIELPPAINPTPQIMDNGEKCPNLPDPAPPKHLNINPPDITYNRILINTLRVFFKSNYSIINDVFKFLPDEFKRIIINNFRMTSGVMVQDNVQNISRTAYDQSVDGVQIIKNTGGGNCFFIAVCDAINLHNIKNPKDPILPNNLLNSPDQTFTVRRLRQLVYNFIYKTFINGKSQEEMDNFFNQFQSNVDNLNTKFNHMIRQPFVSDVNNEEDESNENESNERYNTILTHLYKTNPNFGVTFSLNIPSNQNEYYKPFKKVNANQLENYILSNQYWGDSLSIYAIVSELKLIIVPLILNINHNKSIDSLRIDQNHFLNFQWNKFMFLINYSDHFELLQFTFKDQIQGSTKMLQINNKISIFDRYQNTSLKNSKYVPPLYILLIIFCEIYLIIPAEQKHSFPLYPPIFGAIYNSFLHIVNNTNDSENFKTSIKTFYPDSEAFFLRERPLLQQGGTNDINYNPYDPYKYATPVPHPKGNPNTISQTGYNAPNNLNSYPPSTMRYRNPNIVYQSNPNRNNISQSQYYHLNQSNNPYQPYHPLLTSSNQARNFNNSSNIAIQHQNETQICYMVDIYLMLKKGKDLSAADIASLKCDRYWMNVNKSWAQLTGQVYNLPANANNLPSVHQEKKPTSSNNKTVNKKKTNVKSTKNKTKKNNNNNQS